MTHNPIDQKIIFMLTNEGATPTLMLGIPKGAWEAIKEGRTQTFDLTKAGLPIKLIVFGGEDHDDIIKMIHQGAAAGGITIDDRRNRDFSIKNKGN